MKRSRALGADDWSVDSLQAALGERLQVGPRTTVRATFLDTFDWRLHRACSRLTIEGIGRQRSLHWTMSDGDEPYVAPIDRDPRFASDLPPGFLRRELEPLIEVRALLAMGFTRIERLSARVVDATGDTDLLLKMEWSTPLDASQRRVGKAIATIAVQPMAAGNSAVRSLIDLLISGGATEKVSADPFTAAVAALGRRPGDYSSKLALELEPKQRSDRAMLQILRHLYETLESNVGGVLDDIDIEFLHDLRVATRRTRSALSQLKGVLPEAAVDRFSPEFKWLGTVTGGCRDLDVYLVEMDDFRSSLGVRDDSLDPLQELLEGTRRTEYRRVVKALRSDRFRSLMEDWRGFLEAAADAEDTEAPNAARPIADLAGERIMKAYRRITKRGRKLNDDPPAQTLHRIRIDAKKLRYLLEFFSSLYRSKNVSPLVKELKRLQDVLGGFNDMEIQRTRLTEFADQLMDRSEARSETVFAMGRLADSMAERQERYRRAFSERFASFANAENQRLYRETFG